MNLNIPEKILVVLEELESAGFEAFLVGGCVRDLLRGVEPKDWDITTKAKPEEILKVFPDGKYENDFGTVILPEKYIIPTKLQIGYKATNNKNKLQDGQLKTLSKNIHISSSSKRYIINVAKKYLSKIKCQAHNINHAKATVQTSLKIASTIDNGLNLNIIEILGWVHDIGRAIGSSHRHIENSQNIFQKEFFKYFSKKEMSCLIQAINHHHQKPSKFLEQQILKEADLIQGLNIDRINSYQTEEEREAHLKWIKNKFNQKGIYKIFKTNKGKQLLKKEVNVFNKANFEFDLNIPIWEEIGNIEITTYRIESTYSDNRRPDEVKFAETLEDDLGRRDFTVNAMAIKINFQFSIFNFQTIFNDQNKNWEKNGWKLIDLFSGWQDIKNKVIRAVGDANERFNEDALRMMRAVRFASQLSSGDNLEFLKERKGEGNQNQKVEYQMLISKRQEVSDKIQINHKKQELNNKQVVKNKTQGGNRKSIDNKNKNLKNLINSMVVGSENFQKPHLTRASLEQRNGFKNFRWWIGENTFQAIKDNAHLLKNISPERIRDEFQKIILSDRPAWGVELLVETDLMKYIIPEIYKTIGVRQNRHHYNGPFNTVYKHMLAALKTCPSKKLEVRLAAFFHDIGKPQSKRGHGYNSTFYGHEYIGARITKEIMERLKFPRKVIDKTVLLVKNHMFYYNTDEVGEKGVRKVIRKVGLENINDLIDVRIGDRLGSGVAKAVPYKLRHFKYMVEKVSKDPISVKDLKINGDILLADYNFKPGPQMGAILEILLAEVLDEPKLNNIEYLSKRAIKLQKENLEDLRKMAKDKIEKEKQKEEAQVKGKYWVK